MKSKVAIALGLALFAAGCQPKRALYQDKAEKVVILPSAPGASPAPGDTSVSAGNSPVAAEPAAAPLAPQGSVLLAYSYQYDIQAPPARIEPLLRRHERTCASAGPALCQMLGEDVNQAGRDDASAHLQIRAEPHWLERFRASLEKDARDAGGRLASSSVQTEDLTRSIVDTDAALRTKRALRDRLEALL